ncbi:zinc ribbon protein [Ruminococcaceae bacterium R-25]|nr:zinc ribbon protein [Ruminococcaceae bacterium R-25]SUQ22422.1 zinc-ribbon domain-containing protein [Oscillospiraceae bacterium]
MPFCTQCGAPINENQKFCGKCGEPVYVAVDSIPEQHEVPTKRLDKSEIIRQLTCYEKWQEETVSLIKACENQNNCMFPNQTLINKLEMKRSALYKQMCKDAPDVLRLIPEKYRTYPEDYKYIKECLLYERAQTLEDAISLLIEKREKDDVLREQARLHDMEMTAQIAQMEYLRSINNKL